MTRSSRLSLFVALGSAIAITLLAGLTPLADFLAGPLVVRESPASVDAIVVLGGGVRRSDGALTRATAERVISGIELFQSGYAPVLMFSGGRVPPNRFNESRQVEPIIRSFGVPADAVVFEDESRNTYENAVNTLAIARANGWGDLLVVTSAFHTSRSCRIFRKLGARAMCVAANPSVLPPPTFIDRIAAVRSVVREYGAIVYFTLKGYL